jgi:hypothetical protein
MKWLLRSLPRRKRGKFRAVAEGSALLEDKSMYSTRSRQSDAISFDSDAIFVAMDNRACGNLVEKDCTWLRRHDDSNRAITFAKVVVMVLWTKMFAKSKENSSS